MDIFIPINSLKFSWKVSIFEHSKSSETPVIHIIVEMAPPSLALQVGGGWISPVDVTRPVISSLYPLSPASPHQRSIGPTPQLEASDLMENTPWLSRHALVCNLQFLFSFPFFFSPPIWTETNLISIRLCSPVLFLSFSGAKHRISYRQSANGGSIPLIIRPINKLRSARFATSSLLLLRPGLRRPQTRSYCSEWNTLTTRFILTRFIYSDVSTPFSVFPPLLLRLF